MNIILLFIICQLPHIQYKIKIKKFKYRDISVSPMIHLQITNKDKVTRKFATVFGTVEVRFFLF